MRNFLRLRACFSCVVLAGFLLFLVPPMFSAEVLLPGVVQRVKLMLSEGSSKGEIALWLNGLVDNHLIALNRHTSDERLTLADSVYQRKKKVFDAWSDQGNTYSADEPFAAAHWVWANGFGHCQEHAHTVFHVLIMALEDGENIGDFHWGDHAFVIWGIPSGYSGDFNLDVMKGWHDAYLIDPWLGVCFSTSDTRFYEWYQQRGGQAKIQKISAYPFQVYKRKYETWLTTCHNLAGSYGRETDELEVIEVSDQSGKGTRSSAIKVGQVQRIMPAGSLKLIQNQCQVTLSFRDTVLSGQLTGSTAVLTNVVSGSMSKAVITSIRIDSQEKLLVTIYGSSPLTGATIVREGLINKL